MVKIRDLALKEPVSWTKWSFVLDRILIEPDASRIRQLIRIDFGEGVLQSLQAWNSYGDRREDLIFVLREYELDRKSVV